MALDFKPISADGHLEVKPERWVHRVPARWRDRAPRSVPLPDGGDGLVIEGQPLLEQNFIDLRAGRAGAWSPEVTRVEDAAGTGSAEQRLQEQDTDGLAAEVLYPNMVAGPVLWRNITHDEPYKAMVRAYNDWLGEEYCSVDRDRLIGLGVLPWTNVQDCIDEMEHCAKLGLKGVLLGALPSANNYPTEEDDRFWAAAVDMQMPVTCHVAFNNTGKRANQPTFRYPNEDPVVMAKVRRPLLEWITNFGLRPAVSVTQMVMSGVFDRFPTLQMYFAETRLGWVPFWLEHADLWYDRHIGWAQEMLGFEPLKRKPSEYVNDHVHFSVQYEHVAVELRHHVGVNHIMFATDFPHIECEYPNTMPLVEEIYSTVPSDEAYRILAGNVIDYFRMNRDVIRKEKVAAATADD